MNPPLPPAEVKPPLPPGPQPHSSYFQVTNQPTNYVPQPIYPGYQNMMPTFGMPMVSPFGSFPSYRPYGSCITTGSIPICTPIMQNGNQGNNFTNPANFMYQNTGMTVVPLGEPYVGQVSDDIKDPYFVTTPDQVKRDWTSTIIRSERRGSNLRTRINIDLRRDRPIRAIKPRRPVDNLQGLTSEIPCIINERQSGLKDGRKKYPNKKIELETPTDKDEVMTDLEKVKKLRPSDELIIQELELKYTPHRYRRKHKNHMMHLVKNVTILESKTTTNERKIMKANEIIYRKKVKYINHLLRGVEKVARNLGILDPRGDVSDSEPSDPESEGSSFDEDSKSQDSNFKSRQVSNNSSKPESMSLDGSLRMLRDTVESSSNDKTQSSSVTKRKYVPSECPDNIVSTELNKNSGPSGFKPKRSKKVRKYMSTTLDDNF